MLNFLKSYFGQFVHAGLPTEATPDVVDTHTSGCSDSGVSEPEYERHACVMCGHYALGGSHGLCDDCAQLSDFRTPDNSTMEPIDLMGRFDD
jgi:hypothetical protein